MPLDQQARYIRKSSRNCFNLLLLDSTGSLTLDSSSETVLRLAELVLTLNCFSFADSYYKQISGVAMGTTMGPSYANLFVGYIEHQFFNQYNGPKPDLYRRYIDDCVGATSSTREELNQFITAANSFYPALKYTWEICDTSLAFLDIKVSVEGNGLYTSLHYKPTDSHSYLLYSSSHPSHVKNSIPYSQFLRLRRLCSEDSDFSLKSEEMCEFFDKRGYPASVVETGHHRAQQIDRQSALQTSQKENSNRIPFTLTFHPHNHADDAKHVLSFATLRNCRDPSDPLRSLIINVIMKYALGNRPFSKMAAENSKKSKLKTNISTRKSTLTLAPLPSFSISGVISAEEMYVKN